MRQPITVSDTSGKKKLSPIADVIADPKDAMRPDMRTCSTCGQKYDANNERAYFHHNQAGAHGPLIEKQST